MVGRPDVRLIVWTPLPGMANVIVSSPGLLLAKVIASRSDVWQSVGLTTSAAVVTTNEPASKSALNSLVSLVVWSVAVAVTKFTVTLGGSGGSVVVQATLPLA